MNYGIFIGRFQPFHFGHLSTVGHMLETYDKVIVLIGSDNSPITFKNPWTFEERKEMILRCFRNDEDVDVNNLIILPLRDSRYNYNEWLTMVQQLVASQTTSEDNITLHGFFKDDTSYYLNDFPQWNFVKVEEKSPAHATDIRKLFFDRKLFTKVSKGLAKCKTILEKDKEKIERVILSIPPEIQEYLVEWLKENFEKYIQICEELDYFTSYKASWSKAPFPPVFVTTDAIVVYAGHVLLVKRGINPGKGKYAIPGGFLGIDETIEDSMIRELKEETKIKVDKRILLSSIANKQVFDHPKRSQRGRIITHAYIMDLNGKVKHLPEVKGGDDAAEAIWMPIAEMWTKEREFFSDHYHIINYFINRY